MPLRGQGPKYLMKGPDMNFALVQFESGENFNAHYHNVMEEDFFILEGKVDVAVESRVNTPSPGLSSTPSRGALCE